MSRSPAPPPPPPPAPSTPTDETLGDALDDLENASQRPAKLRGLNVNSLIDRINSTVFNEGLSPASLDRLVDIITKPKQLDQASVASIVRNLYPTARVEDETVIKVIASLGHGEFKAPLSTQVALLRWLVMVHDALENQKILSRCYGVLFNLLSTAAIRQPLCHLLALITRRKHVRPFRIQTLLELVRQTGSEPALVGLLRIYKDYYPDVIVGEITTGRASVFTHPNVEWRQRLSEIQESSSQRRQENLPSDRKGFRVQRRGVRDRSQKSALPEVHTSRAQETSVTLEEIESVTNLVNNLEKIQLPNQLVAVMGDPLLQKFLLLTGSDETMQRIDNWLLAFFEDHSQTGQNSEKSILEMLESIRGYSRFVKTLPSACLVYLKGMLEYWDGTTGQDIILELLTYLPIQSFEELYSEVLRSLEYAILDGSETSKSALLTFYTQLLRQWGVSLLSIDTSPTAASPAIEALTDHANLLALTLLLQSSRSASHSTTTTTSTHPAILSFYEQTALLISEPTLRSRLRITTPPAALIYILHFSSSLSTLSRLCSILAIYKRAFEVAMTPKPPPSSSTATAAAAAAAAEATATGAAAYPKEYVNHFNGFLMDICNCLWRSRAFNRSDVNALGCLVPPQLVRALSAYVSSLDSESTTTTNPGAAAGSSSSSSSSNNNNNNNNNNNPTLSLPTLFSLSHSPVLCAFAIAHVRELEDEAAATIERRHAGPATQRSLLRLGGEGGLRLTWPAYRLGVLRHLEREGARGVGELMYNTMKHLMAAAATATAAARDEGAAGGKA